MTEVLITHPKTGESYAINSSDFKRGKYYQTPDGELVTYEKAGFSIIHEHPSALPYEPPVRRGRAPSVADGEVGLEDDETDDTGDLEDNATPVEAKAES